MKTEKEQFEDLFHAAYLISKIEDWKPGDPYMDKQLGNIMFLSWCSKFDNQLRQMCDKCPYQIKHGDLWLNEQKTEGVPANKLCAKYKFSCYDEYKVAKTCEFADISTFQTYISEVEKWRAGCKNS